MVSVIFLNYNRCEDLKRSLSKIFLQAEVEFEVIVVDQNSEDGSQAMIKSLFPKVSLHELQENLGVAGGRNYGAKFSKGEYLVFIDDDAEFVDNTALKKVELVLQTNININIIAFNVNGHPERPEKFLLFSSQPDHFTNYYIGCGHAIRRNIFMDLGGYSGNLFFWGEEIEFAIKSFSLDKNRILYKGDIILYHRVTQVQRLQWKGGRFYYKVRNRFALTAKLMPQPISSMVLLIYASVYFIRAYQLRSFQQYFSALKDYSSLKLEGQKLSILQAIKYLLSKYV